MMTKIEGKKKKKNTMKKSLLMPFARPGQPPKRCPVLKTRPLGHSVSQLGTR